MEIFLSKKIKLPNERAFQEFIQKCANRLMQGHYRYGPPKKEQKYLTRLKLELKAYIKTGNSEHLYNIANYAHLECYAPENEKFHYNEFADSVTRNKV